MAVSEHNWIKAFNTSAQRAEARARILALGDGEDAATVYGQRLLDLAPGRSQSGDYLTDVLDAALLIDNGANVNITDERMGMTALHYSAARGNRPFARLLVSSGRCDHLLRDGQQRYASQLAREWGRDEGVAELLEKNLVRQAHEQGITPTYQIA
jgi:ankyrin repeat protein